MADVPLNYDADLLFTDEGRDNASRHEPGTVEAVLDVLLWGRARLSKLSPERREIVSRGVADALANDRPIRLINNFGGFKTVRADSAPHVDWAEVFHLAFVRRWLVPICSVYPPGVEVEYTGQGGIGSFVDNIPLDHPLSYEQEFTDLVSRVRDVLPANLVVSVSPFQDFYDYDTLTAMFGDFSGRPIPADQNAHIEGLIDRAEHNFMWDGREDLSRLGVMERRDILRRSVWNLLQWYAHDAERRKEYFASGIVISNGVGFKDGYVVRSIAGTDKAFWMARGVLDARVSPWRPELLVPDDPALLSIVEIEAVGWVTSVAPGLETIGLVHSGERRRS